MIYNLHYAVSSIVVLFFLTFLYITRKNPPTRRNYAFVGLLVCSWTISLSSILFGIGFSFVSLENLSLLNFLAILYLICAYTIPVLFYLYSKSIALKEDVKISSDYKTLLFSLYVFEVILIITSIKTKIVYSISDEGRYVIEYGQIIPYFISTIFLVCALVALIKEIKVLPKIKFLTMFTFLVLVGVSDIVEFFHPTVNMTSFALSIALVIIYMNIQKPESFIDNVTECFNQSAFVIIADKEMKQNKVFCIGVAIEDISFLSTMLSMKTVNLLLRDIAKNLKACAKDLELFYLNQGRFCFVGKAPEAENPEEEIIVISKMIDKITEKIGALFKESWKKEGFDFTLFARIVTFLPDDIKTADEVIDVIDTLIESNQYRSNYPISSKKIDSGNKKRFFMLDSIIKNSLKKDLLSVYYQPIYSCAKQRITGAEALVRMKDEKGNFISPEDFIPVAEKNGCIYRIGEFVFDSVCRTMKKIDPDSYGIEKIDVNLSVMQCMQRNMAESLLYIAQNYKVDLKHINFEITETAAADYPEVLKQNMLKFDEAGIELSLDDYGSGYANMNYMISLPFKMIKIDKGIVWAAFSSSKVKMALRATITMIKSLGMTVLAEGVETEEQKIWLEENGCDFLQGYYFSRPITQEDYVELLETQITENPKKYADVIDYRTKKLQMENEKDLDLKSIKIDEDHELIELIEEI